MKAFSARPLHVQIISITGLVFVALIGPMLWGANRTRLEHEVEVREQAASMAHLSAGYLAQYFESLDTLAATSIVVPGNRKVRLDELATLSDTAEEPRTFARFNGEPVVSFAISRAMGASDAQVADVVNYIRSHFGNNYTDKLTADDVKPLRADAPVAEMP